MKRNPQSHQKTEKHEKKSSKSSKINPPQVFDVIQILRVAGPVVIQSVLDGPNRHVGQSRDPLQHFPGGRHRKPKKPITSCKMFPQRINLIFIEQ